jgi:hypothetical protein
MRSLDGGITKTTFSLPTLCDLSKLRKEAVSWYVHRKGETHVSIRVTSKTTPSIQVSFYEKEIKAWQGHIFERVAP